MFDMKISDKVLKKISDFATKGEQFFFIIDFIGGKSEVLSPMEAYNKGICYYLEGKTNYHKTHDRISAPGTIEKKRFFVKQIEYADYLVAFNKVLGALKRGDTYLLNLTFPTEIETDYSLDEIFNYSKAKYKLLYKDKFVVFSPESFISIKGDKIETRPMKGTISADSNDSATEIINNQKELFEHNTIVDLLRNDLNIVASNVKVEKFRYIEKLSTNRGDILQVSSLISGILPTDYRKQLGNIIAALLPAGSVTGAPKKKTVELIHEIENYDRNYYTGIFGFFDGNNLDTAVSIRYIERSGDRLFYKSGGGITALSEPYEEYQELIAKIYVPFL